MDKVRSLMQEREYARGEMIFLDGDRSAGLYFVRSGQVRIFKTSDDGKEQVLTMVGPGESFNDVPPFDGGPNPASADALSRVALYLLPTREVITLASENPRVVLAILRVFAGRLRRLTTLVEDLSFRNVVCRVAKVLLEEAIRLDGKNQEEPRRLTQQQMAAMVGTAREVVSRSLKSLERDGAIRVQAGRITIIDREALERLV